MDISIPQVIIEELNKGIDTHTLEEPHKQTVVGTKVGSEDEKGAFANRLNFETYNLGHLMMAAIVHRRVTGKTTLLMQPSVPPISFCHFYETASAELARNAICPSQYMGGSRNVPRHGESTLFGTVEESD